MKKRIISVIVCIQIIFISILAVHIFQKSQDKSTLGISVNTINSSAVTVDKDGELAHFYEPKAGLVEEKDLSWLGDDYQYKVYYHINSDTLNQHNNPPIEKPKNTFRIIALGDSFTFGVNVDTSDSYPSRLQSLLDTQCSQDTKFEVLNLGVGGYDFQYAIHRLKERGLKYDPDLVVWLVEGDNFERFDELLIPLSAKYAEEMRRTGEYERQVKAGNPYPAWTKARDEIISKIGGEKEALRLQKERLESITSIFDKKVVISVFENYPEKYVSIIDGIDSRYPNITRATLSDIYKANTYLPDFHPTREGYSLIANDTFQYLKQAKLISCN